MTSGYQTSSKSLLCARAQGELARKSGSFLHVNGDVRSLENVRVVLNSMKG